MLLANRPDSVQGCARLDSHSLHLSLGCARHDSHSAWLASLIAGLRLPRQSFGMARATYRWAAPATTVIRHGSRHLSLGCTCHDSHSAWLAPLIAGLRLPRQSFAMARATYRWAARPDLCFVFASSCKMMFSVSRIFFVAIQFSSKLNMRASSHRVRCGNKSMW
jgi:hypothetical protein